MKRFKLITSIFTLCFSMLALSFGVYAATKQVDYTIGGTISYEVSDVYCTLETRVYRHTGDKLAQADDTITEALGSLTFEEIDSQISGGTLALAEQQKFDVYDSTSATTTSANVAEDIAINFGEYQAEGEEAYTYYMVTRVVNLSEIKIKATIAEAPTTVANTWQNSVDEQTLTTKNAGANIVVSYGLDNPTQSITSTAFSYKINVAIVEGYSATIQIELTSDGSDGTDLPSISEIQYSVNGEDYITADNTTIHLQDVKTVIIYAPGQPITYARESIILVNSVEIFWDDIDTACYYVCAIDQDNTLIEVTYKLLGDNTWDDFG